ncbi:MAG: inorganic phosphate transporter [Acidobacteria bacterium]|nr:inorganic phosphate transporter [Acidobacteriota bacterium]
MSLTWLLFLALGFGLAYANGANDVSKGIATLVGSGVTSYRRAILWGSAWTAAGGLLGAVLATAMVATFGNGLLASGTMPTLPAVAATLFGAGAWVLAATRTGLPVSTTHAIVGSLVGVAAVAYGVEGVRWSALGGKIVLPLLVSPLASLLLVVLTLRVWCADATAVSPGTDCLCAELRPATVALASMHRGAPAAALVEGGAHLRVVTGESHACAAEHPRALRLKLDHLHWLTSGATSVARGMNDAPKIVALILPAAALGGQGAVSVSASFLVITSAMVAGSVIAGLRVTRVLAERVTAMDHREGFAANLVTATLVTAGAALGLPVSTTHVSSGGIIGAGTQRRAGDLNKKTVRGMALAWVVTLPASAMLGVLAYAVARVFRG